MTRTYRKWNAPHRMISKTPCKSTARVQRDVVLHLRAISFNLKLNRKVRTLAILMMSSPDK